MWNIEETSRLWFTYFDTSALYYYVRVYVKRTDTRHTETAQPLNYVGWDDKAYWRRFRFHAFLLTFPLTVNRFFGIPNISRPSILIVLSSFGQVSKNTLNVLITFFLFVRSIQKRLSFNSKSLEITKIKICALFVTSSCFWGRKRHENDCVF